MIRSWMGLPFRIVLAIIVVILTSFSMNLNDSAVRASGQAAEISTSAAAPAPTVMNILPSADTYLNAGSSANLNYGTSPTLQVRTWGDPNYTRESYMKFDVSSYSGTLGSAKLNIYAAVTNANGSPFNFQLYGVEDDSWTENLVTWATKPAMDHYLANVNVGLTWKWIQVDVTSFVKAQLASDHTVSLGLRQQATSGALITINSKESEANQPYLSLSNARVNEAAPSWPSGSSTQVSSMNESGLDLNWTVANDPAGVTGYRVYQNGKLLGTVNGNTWHYPLTQSDMGRSYTFKIEAGNSQNQWSNDGPYVSVTVPNTELKQMGTGNVFLDNEPIRFKVATLWPTIKWTVYDMQGAKISEGSVQNGKGEAIVTVPFTKRGYFTFEASVESEGKQPVELKTSFAVLSPFDLSVTGDSPFGIATHLHRGQMNLIPLIRNAGAKTVRDGVEWNVIEKTKGQYTFSPVPDNYMESLKANGIGMLYVSGFNNPFYDNNATPYTDAGREGFANYADAYVNQYKDQLVAMEAYNEFNGGFGKRGGSPANSGPDYYFKLLKKTYETIKAKDPNFPVFGIVASDKALSWIEDVFKLGGLQYMDAVTIHPYRYPDTPEGLADSIEQVKALIRKYNNGDLKPIWITEFGYPTFNSSAGVDEITQADYMVRYYVTALSTGVEKIYWYDLANDGVRSDYNEDNFGLLRNVNDAMGAFTPKPAYAAYSAMTRELTDAHFIQEEPLAADMKSYLFAKDGQQNRVVWSLSPVSAAILTNQPIQITDMMGNSKTYAPYQGKVYVSLNGEPIYVKGDIAGIEKNATFAVSGESAVAGEPVTWNVEMNNATAQTLAFTLDAEGRSYTLNADAGRKAVQTVAVEPLRDPGTRLVTGYLKAGDQLVGMLRGSVTVGPSEKISIHPVIAGSDPANKKLMVDIQNRSRVNGLPVQYIDWQFGTQSGHRDLNAIIPPGTTETFAIALDNIQSGQSYAATVTARYGNNKTFSYSGKIEFNPIYPGTVNVDGFADPSIVTKTPTIDISNGTVKVGNYRGADDLSGNVWLNFDPDNFYLTAIVKDDIFAYPESGANIWNNDSIQFAISNGLPGEDVNYYEYGISQTADGPQIYRWIAPAGVSRGPVANGRLQVNRDEAQKLTTYELALPWTELKPVDTKDGVFSFSLLVNENDGGLRRGYIEWGSGIGSGKTPGLFRPMQWVLGTAPVITIEGVKEGERYIDHAEPSVKIVDADNDLHDIQTLLDGKPWTTGTSITDKGDHSLLVQARDKAGNEAMQTVHFAVYGSTVLETGHVAGTYSDTVFLQAKLNDKDGKAIAGNQVAFMVDGVPAGTAQTDAQGVARLEYKVDIGASVGSDTRDVQVKVVFTGNHEQFYRESEASGVLTVSKEEASIRYDGSGSANVNDPLTLAMTVVQDQDGSYGDVTNLPVEMMVSEVNPDGTLRPLNVSVTGSVYLTDAVGRIAIPLNLPAGYYEVKAKLLDNPFYRTTENVTRIAVYDPAAGELQINGFVELDGNQPFMGNKAKKVHLNVRSGYGGKQSEIRLHAEPQGMDLTLSSVDWLVIADRKAYLQGTAVTNGKMVTVRFSLQVPGPQSKNPSFLSLQIWNGTETTAAPVFQAMRAALTGSASIR